MQKYEKRKEKKWTDKGPSVEKMWAYEGSWIEKKSNDSHVWK
jgi:hypothetical protein